MRDRSLDEFLDAGGGEGDEDGDGTDDGSGGPPADATDPDEADEADEAGEATDPGDASGTPEPDHAAPARSTYAFAPDGAACAACGARVERRWRDGDDLVCAGCKEW